MTKFYDEIILKDEVSSTLEKVNKKFEKFSDHFDARMEKITQDAIKAGKGIKGLGEDPLKALDKLSNEIKQADKALTQMDKGSENTTKKLANRIGFATIKFDIFAKLAAKAGSMLWDFGKKSFEAALQAEEYEKKITLLTGSHQRAQKTLQEIDSQVGIFSQQTLREASEQLLNSNISADKLGKTLKMLKGFSMGNEKTFKALSDNLSKVAGSGYVTTEALTGLSKIGIDGMKEMQKQLGVSNKLFTRLMSHRKISTEQYLTMLERVYNKNEKFRNSEEELSKTLRGQYSIVSNRLSTAFGKLSDKLVTVLSPSFSNIVESISKFSAGLDNIPMEKLEKMQEVVSAISTLFSGIWYVIEKIGKGIGWIAEKLYNFSSSAVGGLVGIFGDKKISQGLSKLSWGDTAAGFWDGDLLERADAYNRNKYRGVVYPAERINNISNAQRMVQPTNNNTTNMSNYFTVNGTVREEADINKIGQSITAQLEQAFMNSGAVR